MEKLSAMRLSRRQLQLRAAIRSGRPSRRSQNRLKIHQRGALKTNVAQSKAKVSRPPEQTFEEIKYLKHLIEQKTTVCVKLSDDEEVRGVIEYYDQRFIRITRAGAPNLFIFKHDIKYLYEVA
jgi:sRNA-binding regulator protein Hfq